MISKLKKNKWNIVYLILLFLICGFVLKDYIAGAYWVPMRGDPDINGTGTDFPYHASNAFVLKEALSRGEIPLWSPYTLGGMPFYAKPQVQVFNPTWLFILFSPTAWLGLKWSFLFYFFTAGAGMYFFMLVYMKQEPKISFLTSLIYILNGNLLNEIYQGHMNILNVYAFLPLILLFTLLALNSKEWLIYSILAGFFSAFLILGGSPQEAMFVVFLFIFVLIINLAGKNFFKKSIKAAFVGAVVLLVFFGLSAVKIMPMLELLKISGVREAGMPFDSLVGSGVFNLKNFIPAYTSIFGLIGLFLLPFAFISLKKKKTLLLIALVIFSIAILSKSFLIYLLWNYVPFVNKMRGIFKVTFLFSFPVAVLLGIGFSNLTHMTQSRFKVQNKNLPNVLYLIILALVIINLAFFGPKQMPFDNVDAQLEKNQVMQYMSKDKDIFRFKVYETNGIDWGTDYYSIPLGLQDIYGYDNTWLVKYMPVFLSVANSQPAKFFGMLNMKYMTSMQPLNISGFSLVQKFEECGLNQNGYDICQPKKSDGPYLYRNDLFLPRAYVVDNGILVLGDENSANNMVFYILLNGNFNPSTTVVISESSADDLDIELLKKFKAVMLTKNPDEATVNKLRQYVREGGLLLPNIFAGENQLPEAKLNEILSSLNSSNSKINKIGISYNTYDEAILNLNGEEGFLVLSEQYSMYPGWEASIDGKKIKIFAADNIITAVHLNKENGTLIFKYSPKSFTYGALITISTFLISVIFFSIKIIKILRRKSVNKSVLE